MPSRSAQTSKEAAPARKTAAQAATMAAAVKKAPATVTLKGVFEHLAERLELPKKQAHALLDGMVEALAGHLKNGERIRMSGLGTLEVKNRPARQGRNPATGETIQIAASKKVAFRPAKELKEAV
jgi:DNA-binding protein HU-beta